jgi:hypothetical protein
MLEFSEQRGSHDCLLACAAMLTGIERDLLEGLTGYLDPGEVFPLSDFFALMADRGFFPVPARPPLEVEPGTDGLKRYPGAAVELYRVIGMQIRIEGNPALIAVERFGGGLHALAWTGERLLDPGRPRAENPVKWHDYKILAIYPFTNKPMGG